MTKSMPIISIRQAIINEIGDIPILPADTKWWAAGRKYPSVRVLPDRNLGIKVIWCIGKLNKSDWAWNSMCVFFFTYEEDAVVFKLTHTDSY